MKQCLKQNAEVLEVRMFCKHQWVWRNILKSIRVDKRQCVIVVKGTGIEIIDCEFYFVLGTSQSLFFSPQVGKSRQSWGGGGRVKCVISLECLHCHKRSKSRPALEFH